MTLRDATGRARRDPAAPPASEDALVARLRALSTEVAGTPDEEFRAVTRARLVAMAAVRTPAADGSARRPPVAGGALSRLFGQAPDAPASRWRTRLTAGLAGAALTVTALGGLLGAAQGARPGDLLYDLKRGGEQTQLALASDSRRGPTLLDFASTRLDELQELVGVQPNADAVVGITPSGGEAGLAAGPDVDLVLETLQTMDEQTTEGTAALTSRAVRETDGDALVQLTDWSAEQQAGLGALVEAMPVGAQGALAGARDLVGQVAVRSTDLQAALGCAGGPATAGTDALGPVPAACPAAPPVTGSPTPSGSSVATSAPAGSSGTASTGAPAPSVGATSSSAAAPSAAPTAASPGAPSGGTVPTAPLPGTTVRPGLPSLPTLVPSAPTAAVPPAPSGPLVDLPLPLCVDLLGRQVVC